MLVKRIILTTFFAVLATSCQRPIPSSSSGQVKPESASAVAGYLYDLLRNYYVDNGRLPKNYKSIQPALRSYVGATTDEDAVTLNYVWAVDKVDSSTGPCPSFGIRVNAYEGSRLVGQHEGSIETEGPEKAWVVRYEYLPNLKSELHSSPRNVANSIAIILSLEGKSPRPSTNIFEDARLKESRSDPAFAHFAPDFEALSASRENSQWIVIGYRPGNVMFLYPANGPESKTRPKNEIYDAQLFGH